MTTLSVQVELTQFDHLIDLDGGKLWIVPCADALVTEDAPQLVDTIESPNYQSLSNKEATNMGHTPLHGTWNVWDIHNKMDTGI